MRLLAALLLFAAAPTRAQAPADTARAERPVAEAPHAPRTPVVRPERVHVGSVFPGDRVYREFEVTAPPGRTLRILSATSLAWGVDVQYPPAPIPAGATARIAVTLPAKAVPWGPFEIVVLLRTDHPDHPAIPLRLLGRGVEEDLR